MATDQRGQAYLKPTWLDAVKRWSPAFMPPLLGIVSLLLTLFCASPRGFTSALTITPMALIAAVMLYLLLCILLGLALAFSSKMLHWLLVVYAGLGAYAIVTAAICWGFVGAAAMAALLATITLWYRRRRSYDVPTGSAALTRLAGAYFRTLPGGSNAVLMPGERIIQTVDLSDQTLDCGDVEVRVGRADGNALVAHAAAVIGYQLTTASARSAALAPDAWTREMHWLAADALKRSLRTWAQLPWQLSTQSPTDQLARMYLRDLTNSLNPLHVSGISVHLHAVSLQHENATPLTNEPRIIAAAAPAPPALRNPLDPAVLAKAYEAIAKQQITDPATIRAIANAFAALARDHTRSAHPCFDAEGAARILLHHAAKLDSR